MAEPKWCGPDAAYYEHDWMRVSAVTRGERDELVFESCKRCKRTQMSMVEGRWVGDNNKAEQVFFEGKWTA
jgi:hypothetical protein